MLHILCQKNVMIAAVAAAIVTDAFNIVARSQKASVVVMPSKSKLPPASSIFDLGKHSRFFIVTPLLS